MSQGESETPQGGGDYHA